jgi:hypothetical protein
MKIFSRLAVFAVIFLTLTRRKRQQKPLKPDTVHR